jgi:uncharacterized membrane protein
VAKTVAKKALKNAAAGGKAAGKKPVRDKAEPPVGKTQRKEEKPPVKKSGKKAPVAEKPVVTASPRKTARRHPAPVEDLPAPVSRDDDRDSDADPVDEGLRLIQAKPEGILQSELWKELGVDSRKCSRIVKRLEESGLIERVDFKREGIKTYLLRAKQQPVNPSHLLAGDELIPCIGCELECVVEECHPLMDWMYQLAIVQHTDE